jgi:hypothetical protein
VFGEAISRKPAVNAALGAFFDTIVNFSTDQEVV